MYCNFLLMPLLRLLRFSNLLVIALTQYLIYYRIVVPALQEGGIGRALTDWRFLELMLATCVVTAAGYLINDLFDLRIDRINKPERRPLFGVRPALVTWMYICLILGGFILSLLIALRLNELKWLWLYPAAVIGLGLYSPYFKRMPLLGNLLVALYCAAVPGLLWMAERHGLQELAAVQPGLYVRYVRIMVLFMAFAFGSTLLRELIKDLQDMEGDRACGRRTLPVVAGRKATRWLGVAVGLLLGAAMLLPLLASWPGFVDDGMLRGALLLLTLWLLVTLFQLFRLSTPRELGMLSLQLKYFMLGGICLLLLFQLS